MLALLAAAFVNASVGGVPIAIMEPEGQVALANHDSPYYQSVTGHGATRTLAIFAIPEEAAALDDGTKKTPRREWAVVSGLQRPEPITNELFRTQVVPAIETAAVESAKRGTGKREDRTVSVEEMIGAYSKGERHVCYGILARVERGEGEVKRILNVLGSVNIRDRLVTLSLSRAVESENDIASAKAKCVAWAEAMVKSNR